MLHERALCLKEKLQDSRGYAGGRIQREKTENYFPSCRSEIRNDPGPCNELMWNYFGKTNRTMGGTTQRALEHDSQIKPVLNRQLCACDHVAVSETVGQTSQTGSNQGVRQCLHESFTVCESKLKGLLCAQFN